MNDNAESILRGSNAIWENVGSKEDAKRLNGFPFDEWYFNRNG